MKTNGTEDAAQCAAEAESPRPEGELIPWSRLFRICDLYLSVVKRTGGEQESRRITVNQARIFAYIFSRDSAGEIHISSHARDLSVTPAAAGQAVERLVRAGLVDRKIDAADRRAFAISVSAKGREILAAHRRRASDAVRDIVEAMPAADVEAFERVLFALETCLSARRADFQQKS